VTVFQDEERTGHGEVAASWQSQEMPNLAWVLLLDWIQLCSSKLVLGRPVVGCSAPTEQVFQLCLVGAACPSRMPTAALGQGVVILAPL
jgi:hypothetical protein